MYNKPLKKCTCGRTPRLRTRTGTDLNGFMFYSCKCGRETFSTKEKVFCLELWNAAIERLERIAVGR